MKATSRLGSLTVAIVVMFMGCSSTEPAGSTEEPSASNDPGGAVTTVTTIGTTTTTLGAEGGDQIVVTRDIPYFQRDGVTKYLDVYNPQLAESTSLVVLFHPNPVFGSTKEREFDLAVAIASRGAMVVVPEYGARASMGDLVALAKEVEVWFGEQGPCAVWAAVDRAPSLGVDPGSVVLVGDVTGVGPAQMALFSPPGQVRGCLSPPAEVNISRAILFETDWMWVPGIWDPVLASDPGFMARMSFWDDLDDPLATSVRLLHGEYTSFDTVRELADANCDNWLRVCTYLDLEWVRLRDPAGGLVDAFDAAGVLEDGRMSFSDVAVVAVDALKAAGWDAELIEVPGVGHSLTTEEARHFVADLVFDDD